LAARLPFIFQLPTTSLGRIEPHSQINPLF
jgi:hypothetical protein